jgi:LacI family transcriptional regulator
MSTNILHGTPNFPGHRLLVYRVPKPKPKPTSALIVARKAKVSVTTVSRALSGTGRISDTTRQKVLKVAEDLGFRPNLAAAALATRRPPILSIVTEPFSGEFYARILQSCYNELRSRTSIDVLLDLRQRTDTPWSWVEGFACSGRGSVMAIHCTLVEPQNFAKLARLPIPAILINHVPAGKQPVIVSSVGIDDSLGIRSCVEHLLELGHRDIAYVGGNIPRFDGERRLRGFLDAYRGAGLHSLDKAVIPVSHAFDPESGEEGFATLLKSRRKLPTAIVAATDQIALGVMRQAAARSIRVPADLSITGYTDFQWTAFLTPSLTSVLHDGHQVGDALGRMLIALYENPHRTPEAVVIQPKFLPRESTARPKRT